MLPTAVSNNLATPPSHEPVLDPAMAKVIADNGYTEVRVLGEQVCAVRRFNFTTAVVVGLRYEGYACRYCYEHWEDAEAALAIWDGAGHPSGPWIKCKGAGIDLLNPAFR